MKSFLIIILLFLTQKIFADQPRLTFSFKSKNSRFELKPSDTIFSDKTIYFDSIYNSKENKYDKTSYTIPDKYHWGLYDTETKQKLYTITNDSLYIESKTVEISNDGQHIVIIDDYGFPLAYKNFEVVTFYHKDKLVKTLKLGDLLDNMCSVCYSVSHMTWCSSSTFNDKSEFEISTYEYYHYTFSDKGDLIKKQSDDLIKADDNLVRGKIKRKSKGIYIVKIDFCIRGNLKADEVFEFKCKDSEMKKIYGKHYGFLKSKKSFMKKEFTRTFLVRDSKIQKINFVRIQYNSPNSCNNLNYME
jgi:hypothetical protein